MAKSSPKTITDPPRKRVPLSPERIAAFARALEKYGTYAAAVRECDGPEAAPSASGYRDVGRRDSKVKALFDGAQEMFRADLHTEIMRRAVHGVPRFKFYEGKVVRDPLTGEPILEYEYSDRLAELAAKNHLGWSDKKDVHMSGAVSSVPPGALVITRADADLLSDDLQQQLDNVLRELSRLRATQHGELASEHGAEGDVDLIEDHSDEIQDADFRSLSDDDDYDMEAVKELF